MSLVYYGKPNSTTVIFKILKLSFTEKKNSYIFARFPITSAKYPINIYPLKYAR